MISAAAAVEVQAAAGRGGVRVAAGAAPGDLAEAARPRTVGADMLDMSTVPEAVAAREWKMDVVAERTASRCGPLLVELVTKGALP